VGDANAARAAVHITSAGTEDDELAGLAQAIEECHQRGRAYRDQVVLLRTRRQVESVAAGLSARGIPTSTLPSALDHDIVKRCIAVISILSDPAGAGLIRAGMQPEHAFTRDDAIAMLREARLRRISPLDMLLSRRAVKSASRAGLAAMRRFGRTLAALRAAPSIATGLCLYCFSLTGIGARLLTQGERGAQDAAALKRLLDLARAFDIWSAAHRAAASAAPKAADWEGFGEFLSAASILRLDTLDGVTSQGSDTVRALTAHASKGLEFPVVYLPQLVNRRFPLTSRPAVISRVEVASDASKEEDGLSEEASLFYVAMTRARDELTLSYARRYGRASYTMSPFLACIDHAMGSRVARQEWRAAPGSSGVVGGSAREGVSDQTDVAPANGVFDLVELETYQRCPKQYAYRYVDNLWAPAGFVSVFSRVVKRAARDVEVAFALSRRQERAAPGRDEALAIVDAHWRSMLDEERASLGVSEALSNALLEAYYSRQAQNAIERMWTRLAHRERAWEEGGDGTGAERSRQLSVRIGGLEIHGELDVIASEPEREKEVGITPAPGRVPGAVMNQDAGVVVRYRLSRSDTTPGLRELFLTAAADGMSADGGPGSVLMRNLADGAAVPLRLSARQRTRLEREAQEAATGIMRRDFHAKPDERQCLRCPFAAACPE
jgi:ATP-dependent DNA helicase UvrD/PcrA